MPEEHPFDRAVRLEAVADNKLRGRTQPEWANMVGPFGGITAATMLHAVDIQPNRLGEPLALTVNFTAPIVDGAFEISLCAVRTNRTNQHWSAELQQDETVKTIATAVFGIRRDTWAHTQAAPPDVLPPEDVISGSTDNLPIWFRRYDMRYAEGVMPQNDSHPSASSTTMVWVRDRSNRVADHPALAALCDVFFPRVFLRRGQIVPAGTISMTTYFHADQEQLDAVGTDFILGIAHANRFSGGYFDQSAQLWTRDGALLATTHQIVYFKA
jgi:acyl-CoA thioesterase